MVGVNTFILGLSTSTLINEKSSGPSPMRGVVLSVWRLSLLDKCGLGYCELSFAFDSPYSFRNIIVFCPFDFWHSCIQLVMV